MNVEMLRSKLHQACVTDSDVYYEGSLGIDIELMEAVGLLPYEKLLVSNMNNGARFETYIIEGERGSGVVCLNGACARLGQVGDLVIALTYAQLTPEEAETFTPVTVHVDERNRITSVDAEELTFRMP